MYIFTKITSLFCVWVIWTRASKRKHLLLFFSLHNPKQSQSLSCSFLPYTDRISVLQQNHGYQREGMATEDLWLGLNWSKLKKQPLMKQQSAPEARNLINKEIGMCASLQFRGRSLCGRVQFFICFVDAHVPHLFPKFLRCIRSVCLCIHLK